MNNERQMRSSELMQPENKELSRENLEAYVEGCEELAVKLDSVVDRVKAAGKKPVILIPSRGAVPIFLLARKFINELRGNDSYLSDQNANYHPKGIFNFLENVESTPSKNETTDVLLYPFTADVSQEVSEEETIAKELRNSCARAVLKIIKGIDIGDNDFKWHQTLQSKIKGNPNDEWFLQTKEVINSLQSFDPDRDKQIILIDTVISGRAANDITNAFKTLGHTVIPLLAVDSTKGGKFQERRKWEIVETLKPVRSMAPDDMDVFVEFPLISEDKGSAMLGVVAVNFANFNENGIFHEVNKNFPEDFRPQSCVWSLPPGSLRNTYLAAFREFINIAWRSRNGTKNPPKDEEINHLRQTVSPLIDTHEKPPAEVVKEIVEISRIEELKETSSHIISIRTDNELAKQWIGEFAQEQNSGK